MKCTDEKNGGPAFPVTLDHRGCVGAYGMTLRDWFAGQALAGILAGRRMPDAVADENAAFAGDAFDVADAMLAAREGSAK